MGLFSVKITKTDFKNTNREIIKHTLILEVTSNGTVHAISQTMDTKSTGHLYSPSSILVYHLEAMIEKIWTVCPLTKQQYEVVKEGMEKLKRIIVLNFPDIEKIHSDFHSDTYLVFNSVVA